MREFYFRAWNEIQTRIAVFPLAVSFLKGVHGFENNGFALILSTDEFGHTRKYQPAATHKIYFNGLG